jgi:hypothetical protein
LAKFDERVSDIVTVPVPPAVTVSDVTDELMVGPATAGTTEIVYVTVEVETEVTVRSKLRDIPDDGSSPKLKLA